MKSLTSSFIESISKAHENKWRVQYTYTNYIKDKDWYRFLHEREANR